MRLRFVLCVVLYSLPDFVILFFDNDVVFLKQSFAIKSDHVLERSATHVAQHEGRVTADVEEVLLLGDFPLKEIDCIVPWCYAVAILDELWFSALYHVGLE